MSVGHIAESDRPLRLELNVEKRQWGHSKDERQKGDGEKTRIKGQSVKQGNDGVSNMGKDRDIHENFFFLYLVYVRRGQ